MTVWEATKVRKPFNHHETTNQAMDGWRKAVPFQVFVPRRAGFGSRRRSIRFFRSLSQEEGKALITLGLSLLCVSTMTTRIGSNACTHSYLYVHVRMSTPYHNAGHFVRYHRVQIYMLRFRFQ